MEKLRVDKIAQNWIKWSQFENRSPEYERHFWSSMLLIDMVRDDPEQAWIIIDTIRHATDNNETLALLAAGHLEDLIANHGEKFIERFEELAKRDQDFRQMLGGVWQNETPNDIWERIKAIRLRAKWD